MTASLILNFFLAAILKFSMKYVWGIVNLLQVVTHMPLLIPVLLPGNYLAVVKVLYDVARLKIIPPQYIRIARDWVKGLFKAGGGDENPEDDTFMDDYGNIILALSVSSIGLVLILGIGFLAKRYKKVAEKLEKIKYKIMFGAFLTTITKGHLNMSVKMLG